MKELDKTVREMRVMHELKKFNIAAIYNQDDVYMPKSAPVDSRGAEYDPMIPPEMREKIFHSTEREEVD
jgi:hypothetical protein